ncbi:hypothetical protein TNCV_4871001 [Trichonephila clavipes]|nr:hypothetical protein TNCV_4871001 [Trichonephila clavipes]
MLRRLVGTTAPGHHDCSIQEGKRVNKIRKTPAGSECPTTSTEEFVAVDDNNMCTEPQLWQKHFGVCSKLRFRR